MAYWTMRKFHEKQVDKYSKLITKEYKKKNPNRQKIADWSVIGGESLRILRTGKE